MYFKTIGYLIDQLKGQLWFIKFLLSRILGFHPIAIFHYYLCKIIIVPQIFFLLWYSFQNLLLRDMTILKLFILCFYKVVALSIKTDIDITWITLCAWSQ